MQVPAGGMFCPRCKTGCLVAAAMKPDPCFGDYDFVELTLTCGACSYTEKRQYDMEAGF